jgi:CBS-domain-containing membrane protein
MRKNYTCVGACIDIEGLSVLRFDLVDTHFQIQKTITVDKMPSYDCVLRCIEELAAIETGQHVQTIDVLSNFPISLKTYIINNHTLPHTVRLKTTPVSDDKQNMILNLMNIISQIELLQNNQTSYQSLL